MFTGTYLCKLDQKGRLKIPKRYREILARNADEKGMLFFAAADTLRVYTQKDIRELADEMQNYPVENELKQALPLIRAALSTGMAFHSPLAWSSSRSGSGKGITWFRECGCLSVVTSSILKFAHRSRRKLDGERYQACPQKSVPKFIERGIERR